MHSLVCFLSSLRQSGCYPIKIHTRNLPFEQINLSIKCRAIIPQECRER